MIQEGAGSRSAKDDREEREPRREGRHQDRRKPFLGPAQRRYAQRNCGLKLKSRPRGRELAAGGRASRSTKRGWFRLPGSAVGRGFEADEGG